METHTSNKAYLTVSELSEALNVKKSWVRSQVFKEKIPILKLGGLLRFDADEINKWITNNKHNTGVRNVERKHGK